ncbi:tRNA-specific 2-thiouridylase mnmA [Flavonifractor plautii]|uniref:tRNA-uridine 2-sulfurtransferase n=1 Tax=Flavonifractor plautii TaxID=292800 RepID=A0A174PMB4_FLAPL|nr:tRNA-specific 2-thiouridylase mnmA [Flavonifractor plautii]
MKFPALFALAGRIGARYVSTGHYARVENGVLKKGMPANDQSYMLARLTREQLQKVIFPLGDYEKAQVRALARDFGIPVADKPDSMEICFIPDGDYAAWLERRGFSTPEGNFVDKDGKVLGRHRGIHCYTLGQGRGLGVSGPHRYYVTALRPDANEVVLSDGSDLGRDEVRGTEPNWLAVDGLTGPMEVTVRLRHSRTQTAATLEPEEDGVLLRMHTHEKAAWFGPGVRPAPDGLRRPGRRQGGGAGGQHHPPPGAHRGGGGPAEAGGGLRRGVWPV